MLTDKDLPGYYEVHYADTLAVCRGKEVVEKCREQKCEVWFFLLTQWAEILFAFSC